MKSDKYYKADLELCPWLEGTTIGDILDMPEVSGLETATYASGEVRIVVFPTRKGKMCGMLQDQLETTCHVYLTGPWTVEIAS